MWVVGVWEKRLPVCNGWLLPHTPAALFANSVIDIIVARPPSTIASSSSLQDHHRHIGPPPPVLTWLSKLERMQSCWWSDAQCGRVMHTGMHNVVEHWDAAQPPGDAAPSHCPQLNPQLATSSPDATPSAKSPSTTSSSSSSSSSSVLGFFSCWAYGSKVAE